MKIQVTQEHINQGKPFEPSACPVALAIKEQAKAQKFYVNCYNLLVENEDGLVEYAPLPTEARAFINNFDDAKPVEPFEFDIDLTDFYAE